MIPHVKNQLPTTKIVTCRLDTDGQTNRQTDSENKRTYRKKMSYIFSISLAISGPKNVYGYPIHGQIITNGYPIYEYAPQTGIQPTGMS